MNIYGAFALFSLTVLLYWFFSELFTILFRFTGLPREKAKFQVVSLLTGCGFTTRESEIIITTKRRRRLARATMMFGYVFNITIVSTMINVVFSLKVSEQEHIVSVLLIPVAAFIVIFLFTRVPRIRSWGDHLMERLANRVIHRQFSNSILIIDYIGKNMIGVVTLNEIPEEFEGKKLAETEIRKKYKILVMLVERPGLEAEPAMANTIFRKRDRITVFGDYHTVCRAFRAKERFDDSEDEE